MLKPVQGSREHGATFFIADDLLVVDKANAKEAVEHLAREFACMPNVRDLETRHQLECFRPIGTRVA
jgi:hypothetical protein